jgi:prolyl oligopeptidase
VYFHRLGGLVLDDERVYGAGRPDIESIDVAASHDGKTAFLSRGPPYVHDDFFALTLAEGRSSLEPVFVGAGANGRIDRVGDRYVLLTDWKAPRKRLLTTPVTGPFEPGAWKTLVPEGEGVLESFDVAGDVLVLLVREGMSSRLRVIGGDGTDAGEVPLPGPGTVQRVSTKPGDPRVWFTFEEYHRPETTYVCDLSAKERRIVDVERAATTVAVDRLVTERFRYPSKDGTEIPLVVLRRKDVPLDGKAPTLLYGYGGFRVAQVPRWSPTTALWVEMGGVFCAASLRGGDEFGEEWHAGGCLGKKQNVFDDFVAAADWLVSTGRAARERLAIRGGSNGGLLVAVVANQRPDLCRAVVCNVPLTDMLRFHRFQYAKTWTKEYGDPDEEACYRWIRPYSPYHNVVLGTAYPAALVTAGLEDGRVNAFHARKIAAAWQHATSSERPILLSIDRRSGHGSASKRQAKDEILDRFCFLRATLGGP